MRFWHWFYTLSCEDLDKAAEVYGAVQRRMVDDGLPDPILGFLVESDDAFRRRILQRIGPTAPPSS